MIENITNQLKHTRFILSMSTQLQFTAHLSTFKCFLMAVQLAVHLYMIYDSN